MMGEVVDTGNSHLSYPNWSDEMRDWFVQNGDKIKTIYKHKHYELDQNQYAIEFINAEEATVFAMLFAG